VLGHLHLSGGQFLTKMAPAWAASVLLTALVVGVVERRSLRTRIGQVAQADRPVPGVGLAAVATAVLLVLVLRSPAVPVLVVGVIAVAVRLGQGRERSARVVEVLGLPVLVGLLNLTTRILLPQGRPVLE
jgi:hypothetical protein